MDDEALVKKFVQEGLDLPRLHSPNGWYQSNHIASAFEKARRGQPGGYDILRNCCAGFVVDMMSYSGAPADVNALVNYFVERWVYAARSELLNRDYLVDLIPQAGVLRGLLGRTVSDETLVSMIVRYYVWEYYDPHKADMLPGTGYRQWGSGNDPVEYFMQQLSSGVDRKYKIAKEQVTKQGLDESFLFTDYTDAASASTTTTRNNSTVQPQPAQPSWSSSFLKTLLQGIGSVLKYLHNALVQPLLNHKAHDQVPSQHPQPSPRNLRANLY